MFLKDFSNLKAIHFLKTRYVPLKVKGNKTKLNCLIR